MLVAQVRAAIRRFGLARLPSRNRQPLDVLVLAPQARRSCEIAERRRVVSHLFCGGRPVGRSRTAEPRGPDRGAQSRRSSHRRWVWRWSSWCAALEGRVDVWIVVVDDQVGRAPERSRPIAAFGWRLAGVPVAALIAASAGAPFRAGCRNAAWPEPDISDNPPMMFARTHMSVQPALVPRRWALCAAGVVFVLGFGVLALASALRLGDDSLPGLYTFRSATVGDGLLLPLLAYALVRTAGRKWGRVVRRAAVAAAIVGALAGVTVQARWLVDRHPAVNWTFPVAGRFNLVGWYHAGFLVAACGFFAGTAAATLARLRQEPPGADVRTRAVGVLCVLVPVFAFVGLLAEDNGAADVAGVLEWLAPLALAAIVIITWAATNITARWCFLVCLAALLPAVSVSLLFLPGRVAGAFTVLPAVCAALVGAAAASALRLGTGVGRVVAPVCSAVCAAGAVYGFAGQPTVTITKLAEGCAAAVVMVIVELLVLRVVLNRSGHVRARVVIVRALAAAPVIAYSLAGSYFAQEPVRISQYAVIVGVVAGVLYLWVSAMLVRTTFNAVIAAEKTNPTRERLADVKWTAYSAIAMTYAGAMLACVVVLVGTSAGKWITGSAGGWDMLILPAVIMVILVALSASVAGSAAALIAPASCLVWAVVMGSRLVDGYGDWKQAVLSIAVAIVVALFVLEGVVSNVAYLHNQPIDQRVLIAGLCAALAAGASMAWLTGPALWSTAGATTILPALTSVVIGVMGSVALPWLAARALPGAHPPHIYRTATPTEGVFQDCTVITLLALSIAWAPNLFMAHLGDVASWVSAAFPFMALLTAAYVNVMKNNIGHVHRERRRVAEAAEQAGSSVSADEQAALDALAKHVQRQNRLALVALIPFGLTMLASEINVFSEEGVRSGFRQITTP